MAGHYRSSPPRRRLTPARNRGDDLLKLAEDIRRLLLAFGIGPVFTDLGQQHLPFGSWWHAPHQIQLPCGRCCS